MSPAGPWAVARVRTGRSSTRQQPVPEAHAEGGPKQERPENLGCFPAYAPRLTHWATRQLASPGEAKLGQCTASARDRR
jgi:hypothetical protein